MRHERDPHDWQHETSFRCLNCGQRIEGFGFWEEDKLVCPGPWPGRWHWVRIGEDWFPAKRKTPDPDGWDTGPGWTNEDTWEDWGHEVAEWKLIPPPEEV